MSFDPGKFVDFVKLGVTDPAGGWQKYFADGSRWVDTAIAFTLPLVVAYAVLLAILSSVFGGPMGLGGSFLGTLFSTLLGALIGLGIGSFIFSFLAGTFGGQSSFDNAFAALSLAYVPAMVGGVIGAILPFIGVLVALAAGVLALVYLYRLLPAALGPGQSGGSIPGYSDGGDYSGSYNDATRGSGMIGQMQRQGEIMEQAGTHSYDPPSDGKISQSQVAAYVEVQRKAMAVQQRYTQQLQEAEQQMSSQGEEQGFAGLGALGSVIGGAVSVQNAEMEIVVTGGGNWAEHNWVKGQIQAAMVHGGKGDDAITHNYALYQPYIEELSP